MIQPEKEIFLIPEGYKGNVLVIFNQNDGESKEYEDGKRVYRLTSNGVLFTQFNDEQGVIDQEYFYVSVNGQRRKIGVLDSEEFNGELTSVKNSYEPPRDSLAVFNIGTMVSMSESGDKEIKVFSKLSIGTYNDIKDLQDFSYSYIDSLQNERRKMKNL